MSLARMNGAGTVDIAINKLATMDIEVEKGNPGRVRREDRVSTWSTWIVSLSGVYYYKIIIFSLLVLLWQNGLPTYAPPLPLASQVPSIPTYVLQYAPMVWLDSQEQYFPADLYAQVENTYPYVNFTPINHPPLPLTLDNLDALNTYGNDGTDVYLTSTIDVTTSPKWLDGVVPDSAGKTNNAISCAIIVNDRGAGKVDAFYMYFYAYNLGNTVLSHELGDHIGDWEHNMIRFQDGKPAEVWYSQHGNGEAFYYSALEKEGVRPITYAARGSHANYATVGTHDHTIPDFNLPAGFLQDYTSKGMLWDPTLNSYFYNYTAKTASFSNADGRSPVGAMSYRGRWGDEQYPKSDKKQKNFFGFYKFVAGPTGPWDKQLNRTKICPDNGILCIVREQLGP